jgi:hypothetical protein
VLMFDDNNNDDGVILGAYGGAPGLLAITGTPTNGQVPIGRTSDGALVLATLTGTANQIIVTNGAAAITLSAPQDLAAASSPTFAAPILTSFLEQAEIAAPSTPASGYLRWYANSTQSWAYFKNDAGAAVPAGQAVLHLGLGEAELVGAPTRVAVVTNHRAISYADAADTYAAWTFILPRGWAGRNMVAKILWAPSTTNTGNCLWQFLGYRIATGITLLATTAVAVNEVQAGNSVADRAQLLTTGNMSLSAFAEGEGMTFQLQRGGTNGLDTFTGAARLLAIELSVVG